MYQNWTAVQGQQVVRQFSVFAQNLLPLFGQVWLLTAGPLIGSIRVLRRAFQVIDLQTCPGVIALSRRVSRSCTNTCASSFVCTSPLAVTTVVGFLDLRRVSISSELESFLLSMCIDALESTTNSRSSGDFEVGAGVALASMGE